MPVRVSIIVPTQRRPASLRTATESVLRQRSVDFAELELVVVDNDQIDSARALVEALAVAAPFPVVYVHEPRPGVSSARNAALNAAHGDYIAFLDDDEEAQELWLAELLKVQARYDADVVFGPVLGRAPPTVSHRAYLEDFFSRKGPSADGVIAQPHGCGNSLIRRAALHDPNAPFALARDGIGGEDDVLFARMKDEGARFAWAARAAVWEDPTTDRLDLRYALRRAFAFGQGGTSKRAKAGRRSAVALSIVTGAGQACVFGVLAVFAWVLGRTDRAVFLDRAARGLGKVLWGGAFHIRFYGLAAAARSRGSSALTIPDDRIFTGLPQDAAIPES